MAQRVNPGDAEQVVDQAARTRATRGDADAARASEVNNLSDGEEVGGEAEGGDGAQLVLEPMACGDALRPVIAVKAGRATTAQDRISARSIRCAECAGAVEDDVEFGDDDLADAEVGGGDGAFPRKIDSGDKQAVRGTSIRPGGSGNLISQVCHEGSGSQETLRIGTVTMTLIQGDEAPGGVEHIDDSALARVGVARGMGKDGRNATLASPAEGARGNRGGEWAAARAMTDDLDAQGVAEDLSPGRNERIREIRPTCSKGLKDR